MPDSRAIRKLRLPRRRLSLFVKKGQDSCLDLPVLGIIGNRIAGIDGVPELLLQNKHKLLYLLLFSAFVSVLTGACTHSAIAPETAEPVIPGTWERGGEAGAVDTNWLASFNDPQISSLVQEAVTNNYTLAQERARL